MSSKLDYFSIGNAVDGTNYCSSVETLAENLIEDNENDAVIVYPAKDKWASLRSTSYTLTDQNAAAVLPLPIYKIRKFLLKPKSELVFISATETLDGNELYIPLFEFVNADGESLDGFDITTQIKSSMEWAALKLAESKEEFKTKIVKDNVFFWEENSNVITFSASVYAIGNTIKSPVYKRLLEKVGRDIRNARYTYTHDYGNGKTQTFIFHEDEGIRVEDHLPDIDAILDWQFRIEYVPVSSKTKIRARKNVKTLREYIQLFNQRAEINAVSAFGKNMWLTAQKTGVRAVTIAKNYTHLADIPPLGSRVKHNGKTYRLVANRYKITNLQYIQVVHTLSENWSMKSKHVAVDQKYRNWKIPQDILWRNLYWEDYLLFDFNSPQGDSGGIAIEYFAQAFKCDTSADKTIQAFSWLFDNAPKGLGITLPCTTYGTANSLIFSATMQDALAAGLNMLGANDMNCEETLYCQADGTLDAATVILSTRTGNGLLEEALTENVASADQAELEKNASAALPLIARIAKDDGTEYVLNYPADEVFKKKFKILKDPGEAIKFTYQVHFIANNPSIVIGQALTGGNPLISSYANGRKFYVFASKQFIREGEDNVVFSDSTVGFLHDADDKRFFLDVFASSARITLIQTFNADENYVSWGICNEEKKLLIAVNDITQHSIYFGCQHQR